jgi:hypothetical protein
MIFIEKSINHLRRNYAYKKRTIKGKILTLKQFEFLKRMIRKEHSNDDECSAS